MGREGGGDGAVGVGDDRALGGGGSGSGDWGEAEEEEGSRVSAAMVGGSGKCCALGGWGGLRCEC